MIDRFKALGADYIRGALLVVAGFAIACIGEYADRTYGGWWGVLAIVGTVAAVAGLAELAVRRRQRSGRVARHTDTW